MDRCLAIHVRAVDAKARSLSTAKNHEAGSRFGFCGVLHASTSQKTTNG
jgi:hypothetical protein